MTTCKLYGNKLLLTAARQLFVLLLLVIAVHGQEQEKKSLAILRTEDDGDPPVEPTNLNFLTVRLREIAGNILQNRYDIMTEQTIVNKLGKDNARSVCKEAASCLAKVGQSIEADYIGQARLGRFGGNLAITVQLYNSASGFEASPSITGTAKDIDGLLAVLNEKAPGMFRKMPGVSSGKASAPSFAGVAGVQTAGGYEFDGGKSYLVNLSTEPAGAIMSFDGVPASSCPKTPCKAELREGSIRIIAALDQYETADTTVSIKQNNQSINIRLKANFGVLEIKPAYLDGIGGNEQWSLAINGKAASSWENRFSPGKYNVELGHRCYEALSFEAGINKDSREVFDMSKHIALKKGGLVLSAERDGEPVSEPVFVNGKQVGETPFSGAVPLCAKIEIGKDRETVDVKLKHNDKVTHTVKSIGGVSGGYLTDSRDGKRYKVVTIGNQMWMAENLNYNASGSKCYDNKSANCDKYGRLYDWNAAKSACLKGWHLPSKAEWDALMVAVGGEKTAGEFLKTTSGWNQNGNGQDKYGFAALPGGVGDSDGNFFYVGIGCCLWSSSENNANGTYDLNMTYNVKRAIIGTGKKNELESVRCLKD